MSKVYIFHFVDEIHETVGYLDFKYANIYGLVRSKSTLTSFTSSSVPPNCLSSIFNESSALSSKMLSSELSSPSDSRSSGRSLVDPDPAEKSSNVT